MRERCVMVRSMPGRRRGDLLSCKDDLDAQQVEAPNERQGHQFEIRVLGHAAHRCALLLDKTVKPQTSMFLTRLWLWPAMTVPAFIALGFLPAPTISGYLSYFHFVSEYVGSWLAGTDERCNLASIALLLGAWFAFAAALGWFLHMVVLTLQAKCKGKHHRLAQLET